MKYMDAAGVEQRRSSETADEVSARALLKEIERLERAKARPEPGLTAQKFYDDTWVGLRRVRKQFAWKGDTYKMSIHFLPKFGPTCRSATTLHSRRERSETSPASFASFLPTPSSEGLTRR